jgi:hypothetical protein
MSEHEALKPSRAHMERASRYYNLISDHYDSVHDLAISSPLRPNTDEPQRGQKCRPAKWRVSPLIVTASAAKIAEAWKRAP